MKLYVKAEAYEPMVFNVEVEIASPLPVDCSALNLHGIDLNVPDGEVFSPERHLINSQALADYEAFVENLEILLEDYYELELYYKNASESNSWYMSFLAKDAGGTVLAKFNFRLRISNHPARRTAQQKKQKKEEKQQLMRYRGLTQSQLNKIRPFTKSIEVNSEIYADYDEATMAIDEAMMKWIETLTGEEWYKKDVYGMDIFCMSNMLGNNVKLDGPLDISFYFGSKHAGVGFSENKHGIRIKFCMNPSKFISDKTYTMKLHGDYGLIRENDIPGKKLDKIREFFKRYKVLFAGAWENQIAEDDITAFFRKRIDLSELIQGCDFYEEYADVLDLVNSIEEFEQVVRTYRLFNMND